MGRSCFRLVNCKRSSHFLVIKECFNKFNKYTVDTSHAHFSCNSKILDGRPRRNERENFNEIPIVNESVASQD